MFTIPDYITSVYLDCTGDLSKTKFIGSFRVKSVLTHDDRFKLERVYHELVPANVQDISQELKTRAATIAELNVRVIDGPRWWIDSNGGRTLIDSSPLYDLLDKCNIAHEEWLKKLEESANQELPK